MKIGDSAGHTTSCQGASLHVNEVVEVRRILPIVNELLKPYHTIVDCQPPESYIYPQEINFRVQKSDNSGCDLYFSIHLNSSAKTDSPIGSEVLIYMGTPLTTKIGNQICNNLASLGFKNRGLKDGQGFAEVSSVKCPSMIIEVFFVSSKADCDLYKKLGVEKIARAIANGIDNRVSLNSSTANKPSEPSYVTPPSPPKQTSKPISEKVNVTYQTYTNSKWLPNVINLNDYAGIYGQPISGIYANTDRGELKYRVHTVNGNWLPWVIDRQDYAGILGKNIDGIQMQLLDLDDCSVRYRAYVGNRWLPWVSDLSDYAGIYGQPISGIQVDVVSR